MKQNVLDHGFVALVDRMEQDTALKVVNSAKISFDKQAEKYESQEKKLAKFLWDNGHTSPYRHTYYTLHWKAPLFVFRQAWKYQVGSSWREYEARGVSVDLKAFDILLDSDKGCSWNELSGRYAPLQPEFYIPDVVRVQSRTNKQGSSGDFDPVEQEYMRDLMALDCKQAYDAYKQRLDQGMSREMARMFLPQNIYSQAYWTVSLQGLIYFLSQRLKDDAQHEIREYAEAVFQIVRKDLDRLGINYGDLVG